MRDSWFNTRLAPVLSEKGASCSGFLSIDAHMKRSEKYGMTEFGEPVQLLTRSEVAMWLQVAEKTLCNWSSSGIGPPFLKVGGAVRYDRSSVQNWLDQQVEQVA